MTLSHFPHGIIGFPNIGSNPNLGWKNDSTVRFVDGVNGSDIAEGTSPETAYLSIQAAINASSQYDVIYVFTKPISSSGTGVTGKYTEHLTITKAKQMLSIIGIGQMGRPIRTCGVYGVSGTASPVISAQAECLGLENMKINFAASNTFGVYAGYSDDTTNYGNALTMYNCHVTGFTGDSAIRMSGLQGGTIIKTLFMDNLVSIHWTSATGTANELLVEDCYFGCDQITAATLSCDIQIDASGTSNIIINRNCFAHLVPAGGINKYISVSNVRQGIVCNNVIGGVTGGNLTVGAAGTAFDLPANVGHGGNYGNAKVLVSTTP
jgi:hypothetical protein